MKITRRDWRNLPLDKWNVSTFHAFIADRNRELYGVETYIPMRNWAFEQGSLKRAITQYGVETVKALFDVAFREYRPTREYPLLTAGFVLCYRAGTLLPRIIANRQRNNAQTTASNGLPDNIAEWL